MIGSQAVGAWIAHLVFWALLALGISTGSLSRRGAAIFVVVWMVGYFGLPSISWSTSLFVASYVAVVDIVLVFVVFKGDLRLS